jgi:hypothetical protein
MKYALFAALSIYSLFALASGADQTPSQPGAQTDQYDYTQDLDIAKVVRISNAVNPATTCGPVKAHMEYVDSKGALHKLDYTFLGNPCQHG